MPPSTREKRLRLRALQRWFQEEIFRPNESPRRRRGARTPVPREVILPSRTLTSDERMAIYTNMYFARLHDCLADDYRAVFHLLSSDQFRRLVQVYLTRHPSRHYSLNPLGRHLPRMLGQGGARGFRVPRPALILDVARLELAMTEVFEEEISPAITARDLQSIHPGLWGKARLRPIAALRLLALNYAANAIVTAVRQERPLPPLARRKTWVAVYRTNFIMRRMDLTETAYTLLKCLAEGKTFRAALARAARTWPESPERLPEQVFAWFKDWVEEGLFAALDFGAGKTPARKKI